MDRSRAENDHRDGFSPHHRQRIETAPRYDATLCVGFLDADAGIERQITTRGTVRITFDRGSAPALPPIETTLDGLAAAVGSIR